MFETLAGRTSLSSDDVSETKRSSIPAGTVTVILIGINVLVFLAMAVAGVSITDPTPQQAIRWGANFGPLTAEGQWWRLVTACFIYFGFIHLAMNMFILLQIGLLTERLFGRTRFIVLYFLAGIGGNIASLYDHPFSAGAGASGAIFGLYGGLLGCLLVRRRIFPSEKVIKIAGSAVIFLVYNFLSGATHLSTDMAGHLGGLIVGFAVGLLSWPHPGSLDGQPLIRTEFVAVGGLILAAGSLMALSKTDRVRNDWNRQMVLGPNVAVGRRAHLYYEGSATKADAERLAQAFNVLNVMRDDQGVAVLKKNSDGTSISFPIGKDDDFYHPLHLKTSELVNGKAVIRPSEIPAPPFPWDDPAVVSGFRITGIALAPSVGGAPIKINLLNNKGVLKKTLDISLSQVLVGSSDRVWYSGSVSEKDAQALGKALQTAGYFRDKGGIVLLSKAATGVEVSFIVANGKWDDARALPLFQVVGKKIASSVGCLPIVIHLIDSNLETKKSFVVS